jgi:hypothetical protein
VEVSELKEVIDQRFDALDRRLDRVDAKVTTHEHWLWAMRGIAVVLVIVAGWLGIKIRF